MWGSRIQAYGLPVENPPNLIIQHKFGGAVAEDFAVLWTGPNIRQDTIKRSLQIHLQLRYFQEIRDRMIQVSQLDQIRQILQQLEQLEQTGPVDPQKQLELLEQLEQLEVLEQLFQLEHQVDHDEL